MTDRPPLAGDAPFDSGLQAERTALAWRRTALSLALGSLAAARVLSPVLGVGSYILGVVGLAASALVLAASDRRYRQAHRALTTAPAPTPTASPGVRHPGGTLLLGMTGVALAAGVVGLVFVVISATG